MSLELERLVQTALLHQHAGRLSIAFNLFEDVLKRDPQNPQANFTLGIAAYQAGHVGLAIARLEIAARKAPKHPQVHQLLGLALLNAGDLVAAQRSLKKAISLDPKVADFHAQLGDLYTRKRQPVLARQSFETALKLEADNGYALVGMGQLEITVGKIEDAVKWFELAVSHKKELPSAYQCLTMTRTYQSRPEELNQIEDLLQDVSQANAEKSSLHWAAGKIYYDIGDTQRAVHHYRSARRLRYTGFDQGAYEERIAFMKEVFDRDFFSSRTGLSEESQRPVFIFGMPRSGTTLVEQIVSRHSRVSSGAEIPYFRHLQQDLGLTRAPSAALETRLKSMEPREFKKFAKSYLGVLNDVDSRADRVTDKMPHNYEMLWLMSLLFPNAAFVHCYRCPADTCISLLSHALSPAHNYCLTQDSVGRYFRAYASLMDHWQKALPVRMHRLNYEELVNDQQGESRKLLERCGLVWEKECMEFYKGDSPVTTFSNLQVRRPIFRSSIGRWRRYRNLLTDLFDALGPLAPRELREGEQSCLPMPDGRTGKPDNDSSVHKQGGAQRS
ncbi:MAG: sulfotransferase [Roseibium sp.]|uniref:tetratricopeptide repeat-containing sulfotransferase family protein n=1 Tax=Roseibium sp. TaxID=1936156 RepID=UPI0026242490|nr:tetratricopeptide repeat-containing sulfotransferase family protein [Roseibium sp.]MCV0427422.1 sulfotransferase [Roseibium sp.]